MLNLIPPEVKQHYKARGKLYTISVVYIVVAAIFILGPVALGTFGYIQASQISSIQSDIDQTKAQIGQVKDVSSKLAFIESRIQGVDAFQENRDWDDYLKIIASSTPTSVTLTGISLDDGLAPTPTFKVDGKSSDRRAVVLFKDRLDQLEESTSAAFDVLNESSGDNGKTFNFSIKLIFKE